MDRIYTSVAVDFLLTELDTGLTFARLALAARSDNPQKRERNRKNARKAYDSLLRFQARTAFSSPEKTRLEEGKKELRAALRSLGEKL